MTNNKKLISIGIPFYNADKYLKFAIQSVIKQSYSGWELILLDDGSKDQSLVIAEEFASKDERIRVISDGKNKKLPNRLNQLISESKGSYIARMDADDIMQPERLQIQLDFLEKNSHYDLVSSGLISIDSNNKIKGYRKVDKIYTGFENINTSYPIVHPSVMSRKSWYDRNKYSEDFSRAEDFELWTRAISKSDFKMAVLPDLLLYYREEGNLDAKKIIESYKNIIDIYEIYNSKKNIKNRIFKMRMKLLIVSLLDRTGHLQKLAKLRNEKFNRSKELEALQLQLNELISKVDYIC